MGKGDEVNAVGHCRGGDAWKESLEEREEEVVSENKV